VEQQLNELIKEWQVRAKNLDETADAVDWTIESNTYYAHELQGKAKAYREAAEELDAIFGARIAVAQRAREREG